MKRKIYGYIGATMFLGVLLCIGMIAGSFDYATLRHTADPTVADLLPIIIAAAVQALGAWLCAKKEGGVN